jgi:translation initiation factor IF-1
MVKRVSILSIFVVMFCYALAFAHGDATHILGTVTALGAQRVEVKTKAGKTVSVRLNSETKYRKGKARAAGADLRAGDRVVIEATGQENMLTADEIRFSSPGKKKRQEGMHHHPTKP